MKCDELKPIDLECNMGKDVNGVEHREPYKAYDIDEVDAAIAELNAENRRLKRALWLARAERAKESHFMWCQLIFHKKYGIVKFNIRKEWGKNIKQGQMLHTPQGWADAMDNVAYKCLKKAEEYK